MFGRGRLTYSRRTFKWREATVQKQLEIAQLTVIEDQSWQLLGLGLKLVSLGCIAGDEVLQNTTCDLSATHGGGRVMSRRTVGRIGHSDVFVIRSICLCLVEW